MALYSGWGWIAAVVRETRYGHVEPADQAEDETTQAARR
jgi:hypothetical protein